MKIMLLLVVIAVVIATFLVYRNWRKKRVVKATPVQSPIVEQTQADLAAYRRIQEPRAIEPDPYVGDGKTNLNNIQKSVPTPKPSLPRKSSTTKPVKRKSYGSSSSYESSDFSVGTYDYGSSYDSGSSGSSSSSSSDSGSSGGGCD